MKGSAVRFEFAELTDAERVLQGEVRQFLERELPRGSFEPALGMGAGADREFSKKVAARGWIGMALPVAYGGHARSPVERLVVTEEMLRWGAPVGYWYIADRQSGPLIARVGTEAQKREFLPAICRAELSFCIGMSEPGSGSDLSSVATRGTRVPGGWRVSGTKLWTTGAHYSEYMVALIRTSLEDDRHRGLTQMIIDLRTLGVRISPIPFLDGTSEFNEVVLDEVFVPDEQVLGGIGKGWSQIGSELALERSGPDRWLSTYLLVEQFLREHPSTHLDSADLEFLGSVTARWWGLRQMSLSIARMVERGYEPAAEAALVKEIGTRFEQELIDGVRRLFASEPSLAASGLFERLLARAILVNPSFTLRGGTVEILRSVISRANSGRLARYSHDEGKSV
jgi:3-oxocholest-4-en-26-oyl-CoA dehydrogenase alpha subunit